MKTHGLVALLALSAAGCITKKDVMDAAHSTGRRAVRDTANESYGAAKKGVKGTLSDDPKEKADKPESKAVKEAKVAAANPSTAVEAAPDSAGAPVAGEVYGNEYDFVPGETLLFFDDFSDTPVGDFPAKWTLKDHGGGNALAVVEHRGQRFIKVMNANKDGWQGTRAWLRTDIKDDLPKKFTVEFDVIRGEASNQPGAEYELMFADRRTSSKGYVRVGAGAAATHASTALPATGTRLSHVAVSVSGTYVKVYVDGKRVVADPDGVERPIQRLGFHLHNRRHTPTQNIMLTSLRIAEGGADYTTQLSSLGRIVTHGITFDTGSDVIKPESGPTLRDILKLLQENPDVRVEVQGHTDNQGTAKVNGPLSERRAAAVMAWLVKQGVAGDRLTSKGYGDTKPLGPNDTPEGRAHNRRVEFVKIAGGTS